MPLRWGSGSLEGCFDFNSLYPPPLDCEFAISFSVVCFFRENRFITRGGQPPTIRIQFQAPEPPREPTIGNAVVDAALQPTAMVADLGEVPPLPAVLSVSAFFRCSYTLF